MVWYFHRHIEYRNRYSFVDLVLKFALNIIGFNINGKILSACCVRNELFYTYWVCQKNLQNVFFHILYCTEQNDFKLLSNLING